MIESEDYVSLAQAKKLMENGYPQDDDTLETHYEDGNKIRYVVPTLHLAAKWLRNDKRVFIDIITQRYKSEEGEKIESSIYEVGSLDYLLTYHSGYYNSPEEAMSEGIDKALEMI